MSSPMQSIVPSRQQRYLCLLHELIIGGSWEYLLQVLYKIIGWLLTTRNKDLSYSAIKNASNENSICRKLRRDLSTICFTLKMESLFMIVMQYLHLHVIKDFIHNISYNNNLKNNFQYRISINFPRKYSFDRIF